MPQRLLLTAACATALIALALQFTGDGRPAPPARAAAGPVDDAALERGRQLFAGEVPLEGRVSGHADPLPVQASRCINCHADSAATQAAGARDSTTQSFGPRLDGVLLTQMHARRGGPPSRYDATALCRALRSGVDPAYVVIPRAMPRYTPSDADCEALWSYLTREG